MPFRSKHYVKNMSDFQPHFSFPTNARAREKERKVTDLKAILKQLQKDPVMWVRVDPELRWLRPVAIDTTQRKGQTYVHTDMHRLVWQLRKDKSVLAQLQAIGALEKVTLSERLEKGIYARAVMVDSLKEALYPLFLFLIFLSFLGWGL